MGRRIVDRPYTTLGAEDQSRSVRLRPQVHEADRLHALRLHFVERPDAPRLLLQVAVELVEALAPVAHVRLELTPLVVVEVEGDLGVLALVAVELFDDALALAAKRLFEVARLPLAPLPQPAGRQLGDLVGARLELRQQLLDVARRGRQQLGPDDLVRRPVRAPASDCSSSWRVRASASRA